MPENPQIESSRPQTPQKINQKKIFIVVVIAILLIGGGVVAWLLLGGPPSTPPNNDPRTTKTSTPSTQVDETADWKTYAGESGGLKFSFRHPPTYQTNKLTIENDTMHTIGTVGPTAAKLSEGDLLVTVLIAEDVDLKDISQEDADFAGINAKKSFAVEGGVGILAYYINNSPPISKEQHFGFDCRFSPPADKKLIEICEKIASTFEFTD